MTDLPLQKLKEACVLIAPSGGRSGSGFLVAPQRVGTAEHVISDWSDKSDYEIVVGAGTDRAASVTARVLKRDKKNDAAILEIRESIDIAPLVVGDLPSVDSEWECFGYPTAAGGEGVASGLRIDGVVKDPRAKNKLACPAIQLFSHAIASGTGAPLHGFSGAPVVVGGVLVGHLTRHIGRPEDRKSPTFGAAFACPIDILAALLDVPPRRRASMPISIGDLAAGHQRDVDIAELLAWCDRTEILKCLSKHLANPDSASAGLICTVGHAGNRPRPLLDRIGVELCESARPVRTATRHVDKDYGFDCVEDIARSAREALGLASDSQLSDLLERSSLDLLLLCHYVDCERMSTRQMRTLLRHAALWLESVALSGPRRLILVLNMRFGTEHWVKRLLGLRFNPVSAVLSAHAGEAMAREALTFRMLGKPLVLADYPKEELRKWLELKRVREGLGLTTSLLDEETLTRWFRDGTCGHEELSRRLGEWHRTHMRTQGSRA